MGPTDAERGLRTVVEDEALGDAALRQGLRLTGAGLVECGVEEVDGDEVGEVLGADLRQLLRGAGDVERGPDPLARPVGEGEPTPQQTVAFLLVGGDDLLRGTIHVVETDRDQPHRGLVDHAPVVGEARSFGLQLFEQGEMVEPVGAEEPAHRDPRRA
ncbi:MULTISPECIES: hypothetical protein [unclassified Streptomyces]|uniref:hypothetical protein n=1 Tax=unclassified Streptomyces TaxID=2593676 RepID=UPI001EF0EED3|nr:MULTISPECIES: hypothetical protein [unclassified Streptomyces]